MNFYWVYNLPNWQFCLLILIVTGSFSVVGLVATRGLVRRRLGPPPASNDVVSYYLGMIGVFYGITLGLIAVGAWENFDEAEKAFAQEAASLAALYRDMADYPEPTRTVLKNHLRDYAQYIVKQAWDQQQEGAIPDDEFARLDRFQQAMADFEPKTERQKILHSEAFYQLNRLTEFRDVRLQKVSSGLPGVLWGVIFIGAALNIAATWLLVVEKLWLHIGLSVVLSTLIGMLIFMLAAMDNPFRGDYSVTPEAFKLVLERQMKSG